MPPAIAVEQQRFGSAGPPIYARKASSALQNKANAIEGSSQNAANFCVNKT
jgi:hypothetical protein